LAFGFGDVFAANDNFARPTPSLPCVRGSCHEVTEGAISRLIMQLKTCPLNTRNTTDGSRSGFSHTRLADGVEIGNAVQQGQAVGISDGSGTTNAHTHELSRQKWSEAKPYDYPIPRRFRQLYKKHFWMRLNA